MSKLRIETIYTRDERVDHPDGSWSCIPDPPDGLGWRLWDINPDRKSGFLRIWTGASTTFIHVDGGRA